MFGYIYKTTNLVNGKYYIGKHQYNIKCVDPKYLGSGKLLKLAIEKYGKENFIVEILEVCKNLEELNIAEQKVISEYDALHDPNSYNIAQGGDGGNIIGQLSIIDKNKVYSKRNNTWESNNYSQRMSKKRKQYYIDHPEKKKQISEGLKKYYAKNPEAKKAAIQRLAEQQNNPLKWENRVYKKGKDAPCSRACVCIETQEIFNSATDAAQKYGGSYKVIWKCCSGKCKTAAGYHWSFLEDIKRQTELQEFVGQPRKIVRNSKLGYRE